MSRALARLRALVGDPILVKAAGGLAPTARAQALLPQLSAALDQLGGVVRPAAFDAGALDRSFRLVATDVQALLLGPPLLAKLRALAPRADLVFAPIVADVRERIETGDIDLAFALANTPLPPGAHSEPLAPIRSRSSRGAANGRRAHAGRSPNTPRRDHATVAIFGDRVSEIDAELAEAGLVRRVAFTSPHFIVALAAVARAIA